MKKRRPSKWFFLALIVPVIILSNMLVKPVQTNLMGEEVQLATIPVDPRDLFYGDYVILDLEIEMVEATLLDEKLIAKVKENEYGSSFTVFSSLEKGADGLFHVNSVSETEPEGIYIKGEIYPYIHDDRQWDTTSTREPYVRIDYGFDRFYVEEGTGLELEELSRQGKVVVTAKVHNGYAILTDIRGSE